jgi:hypothetical protein
MLAALAALLALAIAAGLVAGRSPGRRTAAALLVAPAFALPWLASDNVLVQCAFTLGSGVSAMKVAQIAFGKGPWPATRRLWNMLDPVDVRQARFTPPLLDLPGFGVALAFALLAILAVVALVQLANLPQPAHALLRLLLAATLAYSCAEAGTRLVCAGHALVGIHVPPFQRKPIASRTVSEFWSRRWNRAVSEWLNELVYRPLARRHSVVTATLAAFLVSGLMHAWLFAPLGLAAAAMAGAFFVIQGCAMIAERRLRVRLWRPALARAWSLAVIVLPLPLLYVPAFDALGL